MAPHECLQKKTVEGLVDQANRVEKEIYVGREGREPVLVRVDRVERICKAQVYVATALLLAALIGFGAFMWETAIKAHARMTQPGWPDSVGSVPRLLGEPSTDLPGSSRQASAKADGNG